jgi:hypothetical protein
MRLEHLVCFQRDHGLGFDAHWPQHNFTPGDFNPRGTNCRAAKNGQTCLVCVLHKRQLPLRWAGDTRSALDFDRDYCHFSMIQFEQIRESGHRSQATHTVTWHLGWVTQRLIQVPAATCGVYKPGSEPLKRL